ncbi:hypothetical protein HMPREF3056_05195 [Corynebacterium sp. HMSC056F09]|uniref:hypothetical protein n=1 Tax=unclassified Corynebacterium TaxID=2624378 RepID=UPI0008A17C93|nr:MULTISPECIES: hypothetical protein [unclassified Corynebacterium]OFK65812.1 hypothetical protein HMPREF2806_10365 [Corynebacterium sp. HMSC076G08]OFN38398.1 hypothetical protein HMPREF2565_03600 [Corynebacterium sp. HMSC072A04]OFO23184.1 hypothetical protein HMPREF3056_05195 [Corynebacterium sp. HMSC056F09]OHO54886.1 hypothetical protein HMPREF2635_06715 [Corynebacterium sp. HMSC035E02]
MSSMSLKKFLAAGVVATTLTTAVAPAASATTADNNWPTNPDFQQGEAGSSLTGSTPIDMTLIIGGSIAAAMALLKLVVDNNPALRAQADEFAAQIGMAGSSGSSEHNRLYEGGLDFDLERLARTNGFPEIADQIAALKAGSSAPAQ